MDKNSQNSENKNEVIDESQTAAEQTNLLSDVNVN
jgi:hypothetical protein